MDLINRYLNAVKFWLPKSEKEDIISELGEDIRSHIDEKEKELGRALTLDELEVVLKSYGAPTIVAERYLPQRHLIGPLLYPIYRLVLKLFAFIYLGPWLAVWIILVAFVPSYRAAHPGADLLRTLATWWNAAFYGFGFITAGLAIAERIHAKSNFLDRWNPRKLPAVRDPYRIPRAQSIGEIVGGALFSLWWIGVLRFPAVILDGGTPLRWTFGPVWQTFRQDYYYPFLFLALAGIAVACFKLARPHWTRLLLSIRAAMDAAGAVLFGLVLSPHWLEVKSQWSQINAVRAHLTKAEWLAQWANIGVFIALLVVLVILILTSIRDVVRIARWKSRDLSDKSL
jgi:hypothetical protein